MCTFFFIILSIFDSKFPTVWTFISTPKICSLPWGLNKYIYTKEWGHVCKCLYCTAWNSRKRGTEISYCTCNVGLMKFLLRNNGCDITGKHYRPWLMSRRIVLSSLYGSCNCTWPLYCPTFPLSSEKTGKLASDTESDVNTAHLPAHGYLVIGIHRTCLAFYQLSQQL